MLVMDVNDWTISHKPYDLRERLFLFACAITRLAKFLHAQGPIAIAQCAQLLRSGTSAGVTKAVAGVLDVTGEFAALSRVAR